MIGVDVLDMHGAIDAQASAEVDGVMGDTRVLRKVAVGRIAVAYQQCIFGQDRLLGAAQLGFAYLSASRDPVQRLPGTVAGYQNAHQLARQARLVALPARRRGRALQLATNLFHRTIESLGVHGYLQTGLTVLLYASRNEISTSNGDIATKNGR